MKKNLAYKLKRGRVTVCLNCKKFVECEDIGRFELCGQFKEVEGEAWAIERL